jgi:hypothetical protein
VFVEEVVEQGEEFFLFLVFQDDGVGEQTVADAVAGGVAFALGGDGSFRFGSVGAGGRDLFRVLMTR